MVPGSEREWRRLARSGQPPFWRALAESSGGSVWAEGSVLAAIMPASPARSIFNSVFYEDPGELVAARDRLAEAYREAGVRAWTVWVPEADREVAGALGAAGHKLDAEPHDMGMELGELPALEPDHELVVRERLDVEALARINAIAYGWEPGEFGHLAGAHSLAGFRVYLGELAGEAVATVATWAHGSDCVVEWVATLPEARGRGISTRLMAHALSEAAERGLRTTTLQATGMGQPIYERLGYRDLGPVQMWEWREPGA